MLQIHQIIQDSVRISYRDVPMALVITGLGKGMYQSGVRVSSEWNGEKELGPSIVEIPF